MYVIGQLWKRDNVVYHIIGINAAGTKACCEKCAVIENYCIGPLLHEHIDLPIEGAVIVPHG